jgi:hypothetical protein
MVVAASVMVTASTVDTALPAVRLAASTEVVDFMATLEVSTAEVVASTAGAAVASMAAVADTDNRFGH